MPINMNKENSVLNYFAALLSLNVPCFALVDPDPCGFDIYVSRINNYFCPKALVFDFQHISYSPLLQIEARSSIF